MNCLLRVLLFGLFMLYLVPVRVDAQTRGDSSLTQKAAQSHAGGFFTGGTAAVVRMVTPAGMNCGVAKVTFQPGTHTIWHAHAGGQIIIITSGTAWYQEKGKPKQILIQGQEVICPPGVMHWHGASPDGQMTHIVVTPNLDKGGVTRGPAVSDEEYMSRN
jgi:quercetin dioxygenase-like cupin family protein